MNYESEAGGSLYSESTYVSRTQSASGRVRIDLGVGTSSHKNIRIDSPNDLLNSSLDLMSADNNGSKLLIWGTRICVEDVQKAFHKFITTFTLDLMGNVENFEEDEHLDINSNELYYMECLRMISLSEIPVLNLNLAHVCHFNEALYKNIIAYPAVFFFLFLFFCYFFLGCYSIFGYNN